MNQIYAPEKIEFIGKSLFLAGPTPRSADVQSWRPEALDLLGQLHFKGTVLIPERRDWTTKFEYNEQVEWEWQGLENCDAIVFWIPRNLKTGVFGLTTNIEFGMYVKSGKIRYGRPDSADNVSYLDSLYLKHTTLQPHNSLEYLLNDIMNFLEVNF
jgi:hypothetical protein